MTEFLDFNELRALIQRLNEADASAIDFVIDELSRLQSRVKQLELGLDTAIEKLNSNLYVKPKSL
jgi:hypothetical protein